MLSDAPSDLPSNPQDPWETPPMELDPELVETSQRLVSMSEAIYSNGQEPQSVAPEAKPQDAYVASLEMRNKYLFERNVVLVAKMAELEAANLRLQEQVSALRHPKQDERPWYLRWFKTP
jgi:hypothetical protein